MLKILVRLIERLALAAFTFIMTAAGAALSIPVIGMPKLSAYALAPLRALKRPWVNERAQRLEDALIRFREAPSALTGAFGGALVVQITIVAFYLLTAQGLSVPFTYLPGGCAHSGEPGCPDGGFMFLRRRWA